jgi:hypothetical protein
VSATPHPTLQRQASDAGEYQRGGDEAPRRGGRRKRRTCRQALCVSATTHGSLAGGTVGLLVEYATGAACGQAEFMTRAHVHTRTAWCEQSGRATAGGNAAPELRAHHISASRSDDHCQRDARADIRAASHLSSHGPASNPPALDGRNMRRFSHQRGSTRKGMGWRATSERDSGAEPSRGLAALPGSRRYLCGGCRHERLILGIERDPDCGGRCGNRGAELGAVTVFRVSGTVGDSSSSRGVAVPSSHQAARRGPLGASTLSPFAAEHSG